MIKVSLRNIVFVIVVVIMAIIGYWVGAYQMEKRIASASEEKAVDDLASDIFMLQEIENGKTSDAIRILQAGTGPELDLIAQRLNQKIDIKFRCSLIKKLKDYREKKNLFQAGEWDYLWKVPGMKEAEEKRRYFLESVAPSLCHWNNL
jgi:hypothetical protein